MKRFFAVALTCLKAREFWICIIAYPLIGFIAAIAVKLVAPFATGHNTMYGVMCALAAALLVLVTVWEIVSRLLNHRIQGEHLRIRRDKGIEVPDGIKDRNIK